MKNKIATWQDIYNLRGGGNKSNDPSNKCPTYKEVFRSVENVFVINPDDKYYPYYYKPTGPSVIPIWDKYPEIRIKHSYYYGDPTHGQSDMDMGERYNYQLDQLIRLDDIEKYMTMKVSYSPIAPGGYYNETCSDCKIDGGIIKKITLTVPKIAPALDNPPKSVTTYGVKVTVSRYRYTTPDSTPPVRPGGPGITRTIVSCELIDTVTKFVSEGTSLTIEDSDNHIVFGKIGFRNSNTEDKFGSSVDYGLKIQYI